MSDFQKTIISQLKDSAKVLTLTAKLAPAIDAVAQDLLKCYRNGGKLLTFGNGGSGFSTGGGGPKIIEEKIQNPEVLDALTMLTRSMNTNGFGYDMEAWKRWLATQRKSKWIDARRG